MRIFELLEEFKEKLEKEFGDLIYKLYLFGGYARGSYTENPDIRIAVIVKRKLIKSEWEKMETIALNIGRKYEESFCIVEIEADKFESEKSPLAKLVKREGYEIK